MKLTPDHLRKLAEDAADNVSSPGAPAAREHNIKTILQSLAEVVATESAREIELEEAIRWALGERGTFKARDVGDPPYWWRKELRRKANLDS